MPSSPASEEGGRRSPQGAQEAPPQPPPEAGSNGHETQQVAELEERCAQLDDRLRRALADLDNYRKRTAREVESRVEQSRDKLMLEWLEAVDSVDRALRTEPENPLFNGLRAVLDQMEAILDRHGVRRIGEPGEQFDPERHEAIGVVNTDQLPDRSVADVARSGYAVDGRVLRPAQVIVARQNEG